VSEKSTTGQECEVSGDVQRATAIFSEYGDFIRTVIRYKIKDESMVEDLFHNLFLSLVSSPIPAEIHDIKAYIYKAILNDVADHLRYIGRYQEMTQKCADFNKLIVNNRLPEDALIEKEQIEKTIGLIRKRVTKNEFKAITSRHLDGLTLKEAADMMRINNRSVSRYISTGIRKVKRFLLIEQEAKNDNTQS
jgi:RNA polymerase sigma factor (sigma-70 family)